MGRKIYERSFCGRNFCEVYFGDLRPYSAKKKFVLQKIKKMLPLTKISKKLYKNWVGSAKICFSNLFFANSFFL